MDKYNILKPPRKPSVCQYNSAHLMMRVSAHVYLTWCSPVGAGYYTNGKKANKVLCGRLHLAAPGPWPVLSAHISQVGSLTNEAQMEVAGARLRGPCPPQALTQATR